MPVIPSVFWANFVLATSIELALLLTAGQAKEIK